MMRALDRMAPALLSSLLLVLLAACSTQSGVEKRRQQALREADGGRATERAGAESSPISTPLGDDAFFGDRAGVDAMDPRVPDREPPRRTRGDEADRFAPEEIGVASEDIGVVLEEPFELAREPTATGREPAEGLGRARGVLQDMRADQQVAKEEARWYAERGEQAFDRREYEEAKKLFRKSLDKDSSNEEARRMWNLSMTFLNEREGERKTISEEIIEFMEVRRQKDKAEIRRNVVRGREYLEDGDLDSAGEAVSRALHVMDREPDLVEEGIRSEAKALEKEIGKRKQKKAADADRERRRTVNMEVARQLRMEEEEKGRRVQLLLHRARREMKLGEYRKALSSCELVLDLDPENRVAGFWRRTSQDRLLNERQLKVIRDHAENLDLQRESFVQTSTPQQASISFPGRVKWLTVQKRAAKIHTVDFQEPEPVQRIRNQLNARMIQNINFDETPLREVIQTFREIAGVNIIVDPKVNADELTITQPITNLSVMNALKRILERMGLTFTFEENTLYVTSAADRTVVNPVFEVYNVSDLLRRIKSFAAPEIRLRSAGESQDGAPISFDAADEEEEEPLDPEELINQIKETTGGEEEAWVEGTRIEYSQGQLFVTAPAELHLAVQDVLASLRQDSDLFVVIEARFIDIFDDFLEDIGLDTRSLGLVNNLGTPFGNIINDNSTGGNDLGIVQSGDPNDVNLVMGLDRWAARVQHIIDGFPGTIRGNRLNAGGGFGGGTFQATWLEPFQVNVILRLVQEKHDVRQLTAPIVTAHNNQRVYVSIITQRAYIADYELVSGGTGFAIIEVADPVVQTFQEGVILDVDPTISHDKKYVTLDVRPTLATLIGGVISTINISLGSFTSVAFQVPIGIPQISLQQSFTSVTVPNGGTVLLGGFKSLNEGKFVSYLPIIGQIPILKNLARRKATLSEKRSLVILLTARIIDLRSQEAETFDQG
ncbi:MAG: hypothetical protein O7J95_00740 [Planctomycetota bacterium]|nr:hypothetical protein [Planctomycetota bacterium]